MKKQHSALLFLILLLLIVISSKYCYANVTSQTTIINNINTTTNSNSDSNENSSNVTIYSSDAFTPKSYSKQQLDSCRYKITFTTADDNGKTVRVDLYRYDNLSENNNKQIIQSFTVGSGASKEYIDTVSDCSKDYYYMIRAFDANGNGSGTVGDNGVQEQIIAASKSEGEEVKSKSTVSISPFPTVSIPIPTVLSTPLTVPSIKLHPQEFSNWLDSFFKLLKSLFKSN